ncbi:uroporphyrinogen decarboxylase [endosymbiont of Acanthamoeba sp. UWC8]|uniref:uroporphyrinogen decarboxylase n=1 Tax=endosymbiont of Acanthamoeba sp. UWC8 TaxID=86106 RepID=UPI0004D0B0C9|nr:uroporphyrinogen decarboxylase [endosymbiont of Acanthamoeba sp. UWC8]AIF81930.1 uroporphyrinogen decarboxylase [endosymbiont of Acanthamoeba sp. UWC8]
MIVEKPLLKILNDKQPTSRIPVWLMRQAGRYLPEYREIRKNFKNFLEFCFTPEAAAEVTIQPLRRFDLDAAIIFSDILTIPHALGVEVNFKQGEGPHLEIIKTEERINRLEMVNIKDLEKVFTTIKLVKKELDSNYPGKTLIGFAGSPWTIACYMVQGVSDQKFGKVKVFAEENPSVFQKLIDKIVEATVYYLKEQIKSGVDVIKLFDSWAGVLSGDEYQRWVIEPNKKVIKKVREEFEQIKIIGFPRNSGEQLYKEYASQTGVDCLSISDDISLQWAKDNIKDKVIQGNFNNLLLATSKKDIKQEVEKILRITHGHPYIFNLNHGVVPETPIENVQELIENIRNFRI